MNKTYGWALVVNGEIVSVLIQDDIPHVIDFGRFFSTYDDYNIVEVVIEPR